MLTRNLILDSHQVLVLESADGKVASVPGYYPLMLGFHQVGLGTIKRKLWKKKSFFVLVGTKRTHV